MIDGREEVPPELGKLESVVVGSIGKVGEVEGDRDAVPRGLGAVDGGGCWLKGGGEGDFGWCVNGEGGGDGAVPMQGGWIVQEL